MFSRVAVILLLIMVVCSVACIAQEESSQGQPPMSAVQFKIIGGVSLGWQKPWGESSAFRLAADLSLNSENNNGNSTRSDSYTSGGTTTVTGSQSDGNFSSTSTAIAVSPQYLFTSASYYKIHCYLGIGPLLSYGWSSYRSNSTGITPPDISLYNTESSSSRIGLGGVVAAGLEASLTHNIGLLAEYQISISHDWNKQNYSSRSSYTNAVYTNSSESTSTEVRVILSNVRIGVSYYY